MDMKTSSPHWHTIFCELIYERDSRCAKHRSLNTQSVPDSFTLSRTFSVCVLCVSDRSRVTTMCFGEQLCTITSPAIVTFSFLAACLLSRWKQVYTVIFAFRLSLNLSTYSSGCPISRGSAFSTYEHAFDCVAGVQSSAYPNFSDSFEGMSLPYTLKNDGASRHTGL